MGKNKPCPLPFTTDSEKHWFETGEIKKNVCLYCETDWKMNNSIEWELFVSGATEWLTHSQPSLKKKIEAVASELALAGTTLWTCRDEESWFMGHYNDYWALTDSFGTHTSPCWKCCENVERCAMYFSEHFHFFPPQTSYFCLSVDCRIVHLAQNVRTA